MTFWPVAKAHQHILVLVGLCSLVLFALRNLPWNLDEYDQAKQAFVSYQMVGQGRWLYQTTPAEGLGSGRHVHGRIATKPPGIGWVSAAIYMISRSWDLAWRLPSFVSAVVLAGLLLRFGTIAFNQLPGLIAFGAFCLNIISVRLATLVRTDMPLALVSFLVGWLMFDRIRTRTPWTTAQRAWLFLLLAAAMFIKGPIVWAFVLPPLILYELRRKWRDDFPKVWSGWWPWLASFALFCAWALAGIRYVDGFYQDVVLREFAGRFEEGVHGNQPLLFYMTHLLEKFAPWSLLMVGLLVVALRESRAATGRWIGRLTPEMFWLISWALGGVIVMSLIPSKRVDRIFPALPPLCLLLAAQLHVGNRGLRAADWLNRIGRYALVVTAIYIAAYTVVNVIQGYREDSAALERFGREVRRLAVAERLTYEVVAGRDEALLLYLQKPRFISAKSANDSWMTAKVDALVFPDGTLHLAEATMRLHAEKGGDHPAGYSFVTRDRRGQAISMGH